MPKKNSTLEQYLKKAGCTSNQGGSESGGNDGLWSLKISFTPTQKSKSTQNQKEFIQRGLHVEKFAKL